MKQKPKGILFKGEMIRTLLNTQPDVWPAKPVDESKPWKWQTRRLVKGRDLKMFSGEICERRLRADGDHYETCVPPHPSGSILYAKETHIPKASGVIYKADFDSVEAAGLSGMYGGWKPSIFMPKSAARLWFRVMNVRVEKVNEISELDALAEGVKYDGEDRSYAHKEAGVKYTPNRTAYSQLWDSINGNGDFDKGQYVWVYELARITKPIT